MSDTCKICQSPTRVLRDPQLQITYDLCDVCGFIYKNIDHHVPHEIEKQEYDQHNNSFESEGYVSMFERFIHDHITPLNLSGKGLEFGSGPGPVLKELLHRQGFEMYDYDYFYNPNEDYKDRTYDFITSTEVLEHLTHPLEELQALLKLLKKDGYFIVMTQFNTFDEGQFLQWWYRRDKTHVSFFSLTTIQCLTNVLGLTLVSHNHKNVFVWRNNTNQQ